MGYHTITRNPKIFAEDEGCLLTSDLPADPRDTPSAPATCLARGDECSPGKIPQEPIEASLTLPKTCVGSAVHGATVSSTRVSNIDVSEGRETHLREAGFRAGPPATHTSLNKTSRGPEASTSTRALRCLTLGSRQRAMLARLRLRATNFGVPGDSVPLDTPPRACVKTEDSPDDFARDAPRLERRGRG